MPIPFNCECGKKMQAKDEFAGRKLRCPGCGRILVIPTLAEKHPTRPMPQPTYVPPSPPSNAPSPPPVAPPKSYVPPTPPVSTSPPRVAPPTMLEDEDRNTLLPTLTSAGPPAVRFVCGCGRRIKSPRTDVGGEITCPYCGRLLVVPQTDTDLPPPPAYLTDPWFDPFLGQTITPWKEGVTHE